MAKLLPPGKHIDPYSGLVVNDDDTSVTELSVNSGQKAYTDMISNALPTNNTVKKFRDMTLGIAVIEADIPDDAIFCPPGDMVFYHATDPNALTCLRNQQLDVPPPTIDTFDPSIPITPTSPPSQADPTVFLSKPFQDPPNSKRAASIGEMYLITPPSSYVWMYEVGKSPSALQKSHMIKSNTMSHVLRVTITKPKYVSIDADDVFDIPPLHTAVFTSVINEPYVKELSKTPTRQYDQLITFNIKPLDVNGPVYIRAIPFAF